MFGCGKRVDVYALCRVVTFPAVVCSLQGHQKQMLSPQGLGKLGSSWSFGLRSGLSVYLVGGTDGRNKMAHV